MIGIFILIVTIVVCRRTLKCNKKKKNEDVVDSDTDSFEDDDDIVLEDTKPRNPFAFKKELETKGKEEPYKDERYKCYGAKLPDYATVKENISESK